jgi:HEAT repeat protein
MTLTNQAIESLCLLIQSGDEADRCHSIRALGALKAEGAAEQLIPYLRDEDVDVCVDTADALGKICSPVAVPALIESLNNETDGEVSASIAEALGQIGGDAAITALHNIMKVRPEGMEWDNDWDPWWNVQLEAVKALGKLQAELAVDDLVRMLDDEAEQDIENEVLRALAQIPNRGIESLIERLQNKENATQCRHRAARALRFAEPEHAIKVLGRSLQDDEPEVRAEAASSLAALNASHYLRALLLLLRDPSDLVRNAAIKATLQLSGNITNSEGLQEALLPLLRDPSSQVRSTLINTLIPVVGNNPLSTENLEAVTESLNDANAETASAAASLLGHNADKSATEALLVMLQNRAGHPMVRREAALALGRIKSINTEIIDTLTQSVGDQQQPVRLAALTALMNLAHVGEYTNEESDDQRKPLDIIIAAVKGEVSLAPAREEIIEKLQQNAKPENDMSDVQELETEDGDADLDPPRKPVDYNPDALISQASNEAPSTPEGTPEPLPEVLSDYIQMPSNTPELQLPETAGRIVQTGEVRQAMSTLDAIAMDNVEVTLELSGPAKEIVQDSVTEEYMAVVDENINTMKRLRSQRNITPEQDVRRLGARILAESDASEAVAVLIQALNDEDGLLRREAADAIGLIGKRNPAMPELMDAVGSLITQLAMGDMEHRITCARALGNLGNRTALLPLIEALNDTEANVQVQAITALAQLSLHGADPVEADHMVVHNLPPLSIAKRVLTSLDSPIMSVRVATVRALGQLLSQQSDQTFAKTVAEKIINSVANWSGEEARPIGQVLQQFDIDFCAEKILAQVNNSDDSLKRSVYIEMLETLLSTNHKQSQQAA